MQIMIYKYPTCIAQLSSRSLAYQYPRISYLFTLSLTLRYHTIVSYHHKGLEMDSDRRGFGEWYL